MFDQCMCSIADAASTFAIIANWRGGEPTALDNYRYWTERWHHYFGRIIDANPLAWYRGERITRWGEIVSQVQLREAA